MNGYKLIAIDLDGTLVRKDQTVSPYTVDTLMEVQQMGVKVVIASGRPTYGTAPLANLLHLGDYGGYLLSYNGGEIYDWRTRQSLYARTLDDDIKPFLYECAQVHGFPIMTYIGRHVVTEHPENEYIRYSAMRNKMDIRTVDHFLTDTEGSIGKYIIVGDPEPLQRLEGKLAEALGERASAFRSEPFFLEIVPYGINKAQGLSVLLEKTGIKREELMAFGDGFNDIPMLELAGMGVAMENAQEPIKKAADFVTRSNEADGVAYAIRKFILPLDKPY